MASMCESWSHTGGSRDGTLSTTHCVRGGRKWTLQVLCDPTGQCFGYLWTPNRIEGPIYGPTYRRTAIKTLAALRRIAGEV